MGFILNSVCPARPAPETGWTDWGHGGETCPSRNSLRRFLENCSLWVFDPETAKVFENAIERLFYTQEYRIGKAVLPQANVRSRLWDLDSTILQSVEGKLRQNQRNVKNSTAHTMAVILTPSANRKAIFLLDPYLNSIGGAPAGSEKGGENQCF